MISWKEGTNQVEMGHKIEHLSKNRAKNFNQKLGQGTTPPSQPLGARLIDYLWLERMKYQLIEQLN